MQLIKSIVGNIFRVFDMATMSGVYALPFLAAVAYLVLSKDNKELIKKVLVPCMVGAVLLLSPMIGYIAEKINSDTRVLRLYWTIPFDILVLYCAVELLFRIKNPIKKIAFLSIVFMGLVCFSRQQNLTYPKVEQKWPWVKAENLFKVPQPVYELCNIIQGEQQGEECRAAFPFELSMYVRQYDASIMLSYGEAWAATDNACFDAINASNIDLRQVESAAVEDDLDYIVLEQSKILSGAFSCYQEIGTVQDEEETYVLYKYMK